MVLSGNTYSLNKTVDAAGNVVSGGASVQGGLGGSSDVTKTETYTGKGYIITFEEENCAV